MISTSMETYLTTRRDTKPSLILPHPKGTSTMTDKLTEALQWASNREEIQTLLDDIMEDMLTRFREIGWLYFPGDDRLAAVEGTIAVYIRENMSHPDLLAALNKHIAIMEARQ